MESAPAFARFRDELEAGAGALEVAAGEGKSAGGGNTVTAAGVLKASASYSGNIGTPSTCSIPIAEEAAEGSGVEVDGVNTGAAVTVTVLPMPT